jgi:hypothetical protein
MYVPQLNKMLAPKRTVQVWKHAQFHLCTSHRSHQLMHHTDHKLQHLTLSIDMITLPTRSCIRYIVLRAVRGWCCGRTEIQAWENVYTDLLRCVRQWCRFIISLDQPEVCEWLWDQYACLSSWAWNRVGNCTTFDQKFSVTHVRALSK